jgi:hypothetical protein
MGDREDTEQFERDGSPDNWHPELCYGECDEPDWRELKAEIARLKARIAEMEPPAACAREEAVMRLVELGADPDEIEWWLEWANRRNANVMERFVEALRGIRSKAVAWKEEPLTEETVTALDDIREIGRTAADALRRAKIEG